MKFLNFNTTQEKRSLTSNEIATLLNCEKAFGQTLSKELVVSLISHNFDNHNAIKLFVLFPISLKAADGTKYNYQALTLNGWEKPAEGEEFQKFAENFDFYIDMHDAINAANACYGARTPEELEKRKMAYKESKNKQRER